MKKRIVAALLTILTVFMLIPAASAAGTSAAVSLDGSILDTKAQISGQAVFLPVRAVCEALGYNVEWSDKDGVKTVTVTKDGQSVVLNLTNQEISDNGHLFGAGVYHGKGIEIIASRTCLDSGLFSTLFAVGSSYDKQSNQVILQRRCENNIAVITEKMNADSSYLKAKIQYPQLSGLTDNEGQENINTILKQLAQNALAEGQKNADDMAQAIRDGYTGAVGQCETFFDFMVTYNQNGLFSVVLTNYQYAGGAHGSTVQSAYTFDPLTGKTLQLIDILNSTSDYRGFINAAIRQEIDRRVAAGELSEFDFDKFTDIGTNPAFYLSNDAIVFYFQEYAYFPYAAGIQEFDIRYSGLGNLFNKAFTFLKDGPVALSAQGVNTLKAGGIGQVALEGNPTTGYTWHDSISDGTIVSLVSACFTPPMQQGIVGAGGMYTWNFKALKPGNATITFKYYREWEGEAYVTPENTVVYNIKVQ